MHAIGMPQAAGWIINLGKTILKAKIAKRVNKNINFFSEIKMVIKNQPFLLPDTCS